MKRPLLLLLAAGALALPGLRATPQASRVQHVIVEHEPGRFSGWPANNGAWAWGDEITVGFSRGWFKSTTDDHSLDRARGTETLLARSLDGGVTWQSEPFALPEGEARAVTDPIDFTHPGFAFRVRDGVFFFSYDRARTWQGPFAFPAFHPGLRPTARTDYVVNAPGDCHVFLSVRDEQVQAGIPDRAFAVRTRDGGRTWDVLGWLTGDEAPVARSVMPATVRAANGTLVTTLRRRFDLPSSYRNDLNWIDAFVSRDDGVTWVRSTRIAHTDLSGHNGNPPSLVRLPDGRLVVVYGVRSAPAGIRARVSADDGATWGPELILRDDARTWDIGYCRSLVRRDGTIVTIYYYATAGHFENHLAATLWSP